MYHLRVTVTLHLSFDLSFLELYMEHIIFFEVGIPNLVCECILKCQFVPLDFQVTVTLNSDLVSRISIKSGA